MRNRRMTDRAREHITHLAEPRFTARVVQIEPFEDLPLEIEGNVDVCKWISLSD